MHELSSPVNQCDLKELMLHCESCDSIPTKVEIKPCIIHAEQCKDNSTFSSVPKTVYLGK